MLARALLLGGGLLVVVLGAGYVTLFHTYSDPPIDIAWQLPATDPVPPGALSVRFTGTSTLLFSDGETDWMVDGWFSRFGLLELLAGSVEPDLDAIELGLARNEVDGLAAVIPVHSHYDHAMDSPEVARRTGAVLVGSESTANIARGWGLDESQILVAVPGQALRFGDFAITLIPTRHFEFPNPELREQALGNADIVEPLVPPVPILDYRVGQPYAIHVEHPKGRFLIQGSAGFEAEGLAAYPAETLFLGVGGLGTQTEAYREAYWRETVERVGAQRIIAIHWDSLIGPIEGPFTGEVRGATFLSSGGSALREFLEEKLSARPDLEFATLPRYAPVVLFD